MTLSSERDLGVRILAHSTYTCRHNSRSYDEPDDIVLRVFLLINIRFVFEMHKHFQVRKSSGISKYCTVCNVSTHELDLYGTWWADAAAAAVVDKGNRVKVVGAVRLRPATSLDAAGSLNVTPYIIQAEPAACLNLAPLSVLPPLL